MNKMKSNRGVNNLPNLTDKETAMLGASLYLNSSLNDDVDVLMMDEVEYAKFVDDDYENASGMAMKRRSKFRDGINGTFSREVFDGNADADEDFDDFLSKRSRKRRKVRKKLRKDGMSRKDARKEALKQVERGKVGKAFAKVGKAIGTGIKKVGRGIVIGVMAIPRGSYLLLMRVNYRGLATKTAVAKDNPKYADVWKKVQDKWKKLGGKVSSLESAVNKGKDKKPILCGKKCKSKIAKKVGSSFTGADGSVGYKLDNRKWAREVMKVYQRSIEDETFGNAEPVSSTAVATAVGTASTIIGTMANIMTSVKGNKIQEQALKDAQAETNRQNAEFERLASDRQKEELRLAEEQIASQSNPRNAILNNTELSQDEKKEALAILDESLKVEEETKGKNKMLLYIGLAVVGVIGIVLLKRR